MEPVALIVTALAAGAVAGDTDNRSSAIKDAYAGLTALVSDRLDGIPDAGLALSGYCQAPDVWRERLINALAQAGADHDFGLAVAAAALLRLADEAGSPAVQDAIDAHGTRGVQVGNYNTQINVHGNLTWAGEDLPVPGRRAGVSRPARISPRERDLAGYLAAAKKAAAEHGCLPRGQRALDRPDRTAGGRGTVSSADHLHRHRCPSELEGLRRREDQRGSGGIPAG